MATRDHALGFELAGQRLDLLLVRRAQYRAVGSHAFGDAERQLRGHQRIGKLDLRIVHFIAMLVADMQDIAESFRDQQRRRPAFALDQHVGDDGGGMDHDAVDVARADLGRLHYVRHAGEKSFQQVVMGGQHLVDGQHAR